MIRLNAMILVRSLDPRLKKTSRINLSVLWNEIIVLFDSFENKNRWLLWTVKFDLNKTVIWKDSKIRVRVDHKKGISNPANQWK